MGPVIGRFGVQVMVRQVSHCPSYHRRSFAHKFTVTTLGYLSEALVIVGMLVMICRLIKAGE
jgi:hypothetical protein